MIPNNSLSQLTSTKYNLTSINCHISQRVSFCWTTFYYFRSESSIRTSLVMCLRRARRELFARLVPFASLIFSSIFIRGPLRRPDYVPQDTCRFLRDSPIASLLADRVPRQVTLNTTRLIALHLSIAELHRFRDNQ